MVKDLQGEVCEEQPRSFGPLIQPPHRGAEQQH